ncbi:MAG: hypothetical protein QFX33_00045 [Candidatus Nezhaarchaeota archaeon]|nr:hypothetical protein [Candidatus Nezhaarchaeota archaeon]
MKMAEEKLRRILERVEDKKLGEVVFEWRRTYFTELKPRTKFSWEKQVDRINRVQEMLKTLKRQVKQYEDQ